MTIFDYRSPDYADALNSLYRRPAVPPEIEARAREIVGDVMMRGDAAVLEQIARFDGVALDAASLKVSEAEFLEAERSVSDRTKEAVRDAIAHLTEYAERTIPKAWTMSPRPGVTLGEKFSPMRRVGCYVPGGTAPLVSSVLHTVAIARAAGVREIVAATPPMKNGKVNPATLYAMKAAGATEVCKMGGATAIAAMAYGTETVTSVDKIVGPGNAYVAAAKRLVYGKVAIDMVAGPSEIMVVADDSANPAFAAADILSQAEHGSGLEQAVLVTDSERILHAVREQIDLQAKTLHRQGPLRKVLENGVFLILCRDRKEAAEIATAYAPEHLELQCADARSLAESIHAAGAIFLGSWTPEPVGDFVAGPSHVLPTAGTAKFFHGITGSDFVCRSSVLEYTEEALLKEMDDIVQFAELEGLDAHKRSATIRRERLS